MRYRYLVEAFVQTWREDADVYAEQVSRLCGVPVRILHMYDHESKVINQALEQCEALYCWILSGGREEIVYPQTAQIMAEWMEGHPKIAVMLPNREGERPHGQPYRKYLADSTAMMVRVAAGLRWDNELEFSGWGDLDFGLEVEYRGYEVWVETRISVIKDATNYGRWSSYRKAVGARNRLLLEAKWYWVGRAMWSGLTFYNETQARPGQHIPTIYELCCWSNDELDAFCDSVDHEHPIIRLQDGDNPGNRDWQWPKNGKAT